MTHAGSKNKSEMRRRRCYVILGVSVLVACLVFYFLPRPPKDQPIDRLPQNPGNMLRETTSEAATAQPSTVSLRVTSSASADPTVTVTPTVPSSPAEATSPPSLPSSSAKTTVEATSEKTIPSDVTESQNVVGTLPGAGDSSANSSGTTSLGSTSSRRYTPDWKSLDTRPSPSWFDEAKVGIFLHWGVFSVPSFKSEWFWSEWSNKDPEVVEFMRQNHKPNFTYPEFAPQFTAQFFDPERWADLFYKSGARYVVLTSKHHEGYTLWPSSVSWNWNAGDVGPKRDLVGDLATAIRKKGGGVHFGLYHSLYEWFNPLYLADKAARWTTNDFVVRKTMPELREIVERYKPDVIWSDGDWEANDTYWNSTEFLAWLYNDSPVKSSVVVNDRWGIGIPCHHGDFYNCHDRYNPGILLKHKWENAMTIDKHSWGYRRNANLSDYLSIEKLIEELASTVSCNGNILINVGPTKDGVIEPVFEERLVQLGRWLGVNGEAVYGSKPWKHQNDTLTPGIWYTTNKDMDLVYVFVLKWPRFNKLTLESLVLSQRARITMLGLNDDLFQWDRTGGSDDSSRRTVTILFPPLTPDLLPTPWAWVLKVEGAL